MHSRGSFRYNLQNITSKRWSEVYDLRNYGHISCLHLYILCCRALLAVSFSKLKRCIDYCIYPIGFWNANVHDLSAAARRWKNWHSWYILIHVPPIAEVRVIAGLVTSELCFLLVLVGVCQCKVRVTKPALAPKKHEMRRTCAGTKKNSGTMGPIVSSC